MTSATTTASTRADDVVRPVISDDTFGYHRVNVAAQRRDMNSLLNWTERIIRTRQECPEIGWGDYQVLPSGAAAVLAIRYDWRGTAVLTLHNFSDRRQRVRFRLEERPLKRLVNLFQEEVVLAGNTNYDIELEPYAYRWYRLGGYDTSRDQHEF